MCGLWSAVLTQLAASVSLRLEIDVSCFSNKLSLFARNVFMISTSIDVSRSVLVWVQAHGSRA